MTYIKHILAHVHPIYLQQMTAVRSPRTACWQKGQVWEMNAITS